MLFLGFRCLICRVEEKAAEEQRKQTDVQQIVDDAYVQAIKDAEPHIEPKCVKPRDAGGFYEGFPPAGPDATPRKRRKMVNMSLLFCA